MPPTCDPADINYNLCQVTVEQMTELQQRVDFTNAALWFLIGALVCLVVGQLVIVPILRGRGAH